MPKTTWSSWPKSFSASKKERMAGNLEFAEGLEEHGMVPSPAKPESMRAIDTMVSFIHRQTR